MVEATFTIPSSDFNDEIIEKLRAFLHGQHGLLTIHFAPSAKKFAEKRLAKQSKEDYFAQLDRAIARSHKGEHLVSFTTEEFDTFTGQTHI